MRNECYFSCKLGDSGTLSYQCIILDFNEICPDITFYCFSIVKKNKQDVQTV